MRNDSLQHFQSLDGAQFAAVMRQVGFAAAACYLRGPGQLIQVLSSETETEVAWPAAVSLSSFDYTPAKGNLLPHGWVRPAPGASGQNQWPKGTIFYHPEQSLLEPRLVLAAVPPPGKRSRQGELNGMLEAVASRIRGFFLQQRVREDATNAGLAAHVTRLGLDLRILLDHEIRTPIASISGYIQLLSELDFTKPADQVTATDYAKVLTAESNNALLALDKLQVVLHGAPEVRPSTFEAAAQVRATCERLRQEAALLIGHQAASRLKVSFREATAAPSTLTGDPALFSAAVWEVLKNAGTYARTGRVEVNLYHADQTLVLEIADDGSGVANGAEDLIFLRFYQDPSSQSQGRPRLGLGLGLFLARDITERHLGQLTYIRQKQGSLFRFVWPLAGSLGDHAQTALLRRGA